MPARPRRVACLRCARRIVAGKQQVCEDGEGKQPHAAAAQTPQFECFADIWIGSSAKCTYCQGLKKACQSATGTLRTKIKTLTEESLREPRNDERFNKASLAVAKALQKEKEKEKKHPQMAKMDLRRRQVVALESIATSLVGIAGDVSTIREGLALSATRTTALPPMTEGDNDE
ncbi:hypothetical protein PG997_011728 [Apiospora hydei]|uniref:Uncharacterized protein n=1 Tax=Apiospora hydei TaxID=1337664 RepID=A0ABR1V1B4_9PEZI